MATAVHSADEGHALPTETVFARARLGGLLLILSDAAFVTSAYAASLYLKILNVNGQFRAPGEATPSIGLGLVLTAVIVVSAACYWWGEQRLRAGNMSGYRTGVFAAWILALIALVGQVYVLFGLRYATPIHAYGSLAIILSAYHLVHLVLTAIIGLLLLGRISRNRIAGHEYVAEVSGYWWTYVAIAAITTWLVTSYVT